VNATYDILQAIMGKPPVAEVEKPRTRKITTREDATVTQILRKLSAADLAKLLGK
jgi:hypothetical protein